MLGQQNVSDYMTSYTLPKIKPLKLFFPINITQKTTQLVTFLSLSLSLFDTVF